MLFDEVREILCRIAGRWAGVPADVDARTREIGAMIEHSGSMGPRNWWSQLLRQRNERWARSTIERVRTGSIDAPEGTPLPTIASHRDKQGDLLDANIAAVELINILRPMVAVAHFIMFEAVALDRHSDARELVRGDNNADIECFVQEVRRSYPFFPFIGGRVRAPFTWEGHRLRAGDRVLLDLYGTNHDRRIREDPDAFRPERFRGWQGNPWTPVPQGAGNHHTSHRCPGEWVTIALMSQAARFLTRETTFDMPAQDLTIPPSHMPSKPRNGVVLRNVRSNS